MAKYLSASKAPLKKMKQMLNSVLSVFTEIITSKKMSDSKISELETMLNLFFYNIFDINFYWSWRLTLLTDILTALIKTPLENTIPNKKTLKLYERLDVMNKVTYYIFQTTQITYSSQLIADFLEYIKGESEYNYYALLFYRVNQQTVKSIFTLEVADATPKELYFGISTGYFPYREGMSECYLRLVEMVSEYSKENENKSFESISNAGKAGDAIVEYTPPYVLMFLKNDGFISKETYQRLTDMSDRQANS